LEPVGMAGGHSVMELSAEMRWFWAGNGKDAPFRALGTRLGLGPAEVRTDHYLVFPGSGVGVKMREGRLEIKQRLGSRAETDWEGIMEHWVKWSADAAPDHFRGNGTWRAVRKSRRLLVLVRGEAELVPAPPESDPGEGCNLELTELEMNGTRAWTLGFEAYGASRREQLLESVLRRYAADLRAIPVLIGQSMGYPEWLLRGGD
jgi:hypothetical protein